MAMLTSLLISLSFCTLTVCGFLIASAPMAHWFVVPVWLCGVLIGRDAVDWFRGRVSLFDPAGIIGLIGVHFLFLAPLLHVAWDSWMLYVEPPPDWRPWLGGMAVVNAAGLLLYRAAREKGRRTRPAPRPPPDAGWIRRGVSSWPDAGWRSAAACNCRSMPPTGAFDPSGREPA